jgi:gliding motility-associated-like protein
MKQMCSKLSQTILCFCILLLGLNAKAQCTWTSFFYDSFEYTTVIPYIIPGTTYQNTPQTFAGCVHAGSRGLYLNFADGVSGMVYDQPFTNVCPGASYRFSFWTRDAFSSTNNMTFKVVDASNNVISTQTVITNSTWQNVIMPAFIAPTSTIRFQIFTNTLGGPGNDAGLDELTLSVCSPPVANYTFTQCSSAGAANLYNQITNGLSSNGTWTGPSTLTNGYQGTFTPGTNTNGTYTYTIDAGGTCPDSVATVLVNSITTPNINPLGPISNCGPYTLPAITGTGLSGNQRYYTGVNGTGTILNAGAVISTSQTLYMYGGASGCSDQETVVITISSPVNAGNDNSGTLCGEGPTITLNSYLSAGATAGGTWSETTAPPSGAFNSTTTSWVTEGLNPGTYTFTYNVPANGACPADVANFSILIGNVPEVDLGNDTTLCIGQTMTMNAGVYDTYQWNNGSTGPTKFVSNPGGLYWVKVGTLGANQIVNGGFESGNSGFTTQYTPGTGGTWGLLSNPGTYAITTSPNLVHSNFSSCQDHTAAPGVNMYVANGASTANTQVWCQTVPVQPNTTYQFGTWVASVVTDPNVAQLQFSINGTPLGTTFSPSANPCTWKQFTQNWLSTATTTAQICIVNQNVAGSGNDFAIDDITFKPVCYSIDTILVSYSPNPVVNLGPDQAHCEGTPVTFDAGNPGMDYAWNSTDTTQTISPTTSGNYSVVVTNQYGCTGTDNVNLSFETQKTAGNDSLDFTCSTNNAFALSDLSSANTTAGGTWESLTASFAGTIDAVTGDLGLTGQAGTFDFEYVVFGTLCPNDTANFQLTVHQQPVAAPDQTLHFCNSIGDVQDFTPYLNHPFEPVTGSWETSANVPAGSFDTTNSTFSVGGVAHDDYQFNYILPSDPGCVPDTTTIDVQITAVPQISFVSNVNEGCQPLNVNFTNTSTVQGNTIYTWNLGDGTSSNNPADVYVQYEAAACYDITLTATSDGLCTSTQTLNDMICVHPVPVAAFTYGPQQVYSDGPTVQFTNESTNNDFNAWTFGDGGSSTAIEPEHTYPIGEVGSYEVMLIVSTQFGCSDTAIKPVIVKDQLIYYVPNTFTPDADENNPVFIPVITAGMDENDYQLEIYNRWGEMVFVTNDIHEGWDGTFNGKMADTGTYIWKLYFGLIETDGKETAVGHVNLFR